MINWLKDRFKEDGTYAGLSAVTMGLGLLFKVDEAEAIAQGIGAAGDAFTSGDFLTGFGIIFGSVAVAVKQKR